MPGPPGYACGRLPRCRLAPSRRRFTAFLREPALARRTGTVARGAEADVSPLRARLVSALTRSALLRA